MTQRKPCQRLVTEWTIAVAAALWMVTFRDALGQYPRDVTREVNDLITSCRLHDDSASVTECRSQQQRFLRSYQLAIGGDYAGQRAVAACLSDGCYGGVRINAMEACGWRLVILLSGHREIDISDSELAEVACGSLTSSERNTAVARSIAILHDIRAGQK